MNTPTPFTSRLVHGGPLVVGAWLRTTSVVTADVLGSCGFDFIVLDAQHGEGGVDSALALLPALDRGGASVLVRPASADPSSIGRALDLGADGVVVPMVETAQQAHHIIDACRYAPAGRRSYGPVRVATGDPEGANRTVACIPMIETRDGLAAAEQIAAVTGIDAVFVGLMDLAISLGVARDAVATSPLLDDAIARVVEAAGDRPVGTIGFTDAHASRMAERGVRFITVGSDVTFLRRAATDQLEATRAATQRAVMATAGTRAGDVPLDPEDVS